MNVAGAAPSSKSLARLALPAILAVALALRLAFALVIPQPENAVGDSVEYDLLARHVLAGQGLTYGEPWLPSARRTPFYPVALAATYWLFGLGDYKPLLVLQALADVVVVGLVGWLAGQAWQARRVGLLAAAGWALYLAGAQLTGRLLADSLFTSLLVAGVSLLVAAVREIGRRPRPGRPLLLAGLSGLLLGLASLARPTALPLALLLLGVLFLLSWGRRWRADGRPAEQPIRPPSAPESASTSRGLLRSNRGLLNLFRDPPVNKLWAVAGLLLAGWALMLLPWIVRNYAAFGQFVPGSTLLGFNFYQTHYRLDQPDYTRLPGVPATSRALYAELRAAGREPTALNEVQLYDEAMRLGWQMVRRYPLRALHLVGLRVGQLWLNLGFGGQPSPATLVFALSNIVLLALAALAELWAWRARFWRRLDLPALLVHGAALSILLYFTASHAAIIAAGRYAIPATPFLIVLAAGAAAPLLDRQRFSSLSGAKP